MARWEHVLQGSALYRPVDLAVQPVRQLPGLFLVETPERPVHLRASAAMGLRGREPGWWVSVWREVSGWWHPWAGTCPEPCARSVCPRRCSQGAGARRRREGHPVGKVPSGCPWRRGRCSWYRRWRGRPACAHGMCGMLRVGVDATARGWSRLSDGGAQHPDGHRQHGVAHLGELRAVGVARLFRCRWRGMNEETAAAMKSCGRRRTPT